MNSDRLARPVFCQLTRNGYLSGMLPADNKTGLARGGAVIPCLFLLVTLAIVGAYSRVSLAIVIIDGGPPLAAMLMATTMGLLLLRLIGLAGVPLCELAALACALGLGVMALLVVALGLIGWLRYVPVVVVLLGVVAAALEIGLRGTARGVASAVGGGNNRQESNDPVPVGLRWSTLLGAPFLAFALVCATLPPGAPLREEGNGYDVLEYHLAAPKEYLAAGRIAYLPHNIYANMPANAEMLYLLMMLAAGGALQGMYAAQLMHVGLGVAAVLAVWAAARPLGRMPARVAYLCAAACPLLAHLAGLAYAELGLLAMTSGALACVIRGGLCDGMLAARWAMLGGAFAGLACGFKYTALPMVALPLGLAWLMFGGHGGVARGRFISTGLLIVAALMCFAPWLIKNARATGNPVFPLARSLLPERTGIWNDDLAGRFSEGHLPDPAQRSAVGRLKALAVQAVASPLFGVMLWPIGTLGAAALLRRRRGAARAGAMAAPGGRAICMICLALLCGTLITWAVATHLVARFAIPIVAPLAVLCGAAWTFVEHRGLMRGACIAAALGMATNLGLLVNHRGHDAPFGPSRDLPGATGFMVELGPRADLNERLRAGRRLLLIAEARTLYLHGAPPAYDYRVVFNRNPFAEFAAEHSPRETIDWLRHGGFDDVYVDWSEMHRLRASRYGFWPGVDQALFDKLEQAGLKRVKDYALADDCPPYATLYNCE